MTNATDELLSLLDDFEHECFMLRVEASETRAKDEAVREAYERIREESAQAIAATLGELNPDGFPIGLTISDDGDLLDWRGENYVRQSALVGGKLTAEQVRETVDKHWHDLPADFDMPEATALPEYSYDWQAIADELSAALGGGECVPHGEWESISQTQEVRHIFCECGHELGMDRRDSLPFHRTSLCAIPNYCEECGRKIRKAVER